METHREHIAGDGSREIKSAQEEKIFHLRERIAEAVRAEMKSGGAIHFKENKLSDAAKESKDEADPEELIARVKSALTDRDLDMWDKFEKLKAHKLAPQEVEYFLEEFDAYEEKLSAEESEKLDSHTKYTPRLMYMAFLANKLTPEFLAALRDRREMLH